VLFAGGALVDKDIVKHGASLVEHRLILTSR
jgi:hypothetical protein